MIDLQTDIAYESPMNGSKIPVDPSVTEGMLERRREKNCFYVPTPADELAHIIPHCIFDKNGEFSTYYVDRCDELFDSVQADEEQLRLFKELLDKVFFKAGQLVFDHVRENRYSDIRVELKQFSEY